VAKTLRKRPGWRSPGRLGPTLRRRKPGLSENDGLLRGSRVSPADITHEDDQATTEAIITARYVGEPYRGLLVKRYRRKDGGVTWAEVDGFLAPGRNH
jgi:hypothetical protein